MDTPHAQLSTSEVALEAGNWMVGLGIITMTLFPFALPGLLLALLLVLPALPLVLVTLVIWLLARIILLPLRRLRSRSSSRRAAASQVDEAPALTEVSGRRPRAQSPTARTNAASVR
jgi:hypothetical protein